MNERAKEFLDWIKDNASEEDIEIVLWRCGIISLQELKDWQNVSKTVVYRRWKNIVDFINN